MKLGRARCVPIVLFILALISRLITAAVLVHNHGPGLFYKGNEPSYIASHIVAGEGFSSPYKDTPIAPTAQQPPLYPAMIAAVFSVFGPFTLGSLWVLLAIHSLAGAATVLLILWCGARYFSPRAGLLAACFWIAWPYESLFDLPIGVYGLSALAVSLWLGGAPHVLSVSNRKRDWFLAGVGVALSLLLNPALAPIFLASAVWLRRRNRSLRLLLTASAAVLLTLAPWIIRNYRCFHRFIPLRDTMGAQMYVGNHSGMKGVEEFGDDFPSVNPQQFAQLGEIRYMDLKKAQALDFIRHDPQSFVRRSTRRAFDFWFDPGFIPWGILSILAFTCTGALLLSEGSRRMGLFLLLTILLFPMIYYVSRFWTVYRHPIEPLLLLGAFSAVELLSKSPWKRVEAPQTNVYLEGECA